MRRRAAAVAFAVALVAVPAAAQAPGRSPTLEDVYKALDLVPPKAVGKGPFKVGDKIEFECGLKNVTKKDVGPPPPASPGQKDSKVIGIEQYWVERLGGDPRIPVIPPQTTFDGRRYGNGGAIIQAETIKAGEVLPLTFSNRVETTGFPPGKYRFHVEYQRLDPQRVLKTRSVEFELKK